MKPLAAFLSVWLVLGPTLAQAQTRAMAVPRATVLPIGAPSLTIPTLSAPSLDGAVPSISLTASIPALTLVPVLNGLKAAETPAVVKAVSLKPVRAVAAVKAKTAATVQKADEKETASAQAERLVSETVASWGPDREAEEVSAPEIASNVELTALAKPLSAPSASDKPTVPAPEAPKPSRAAAFAKPLLVFGAVLIAAALAAQMLPALLPAALVAAKGGIAWAGLGLAAASRFVRAPGSAPDVPRGPPAKEGGSFSSFRGMWAAARDSAEAQKSFETRVGGSSWSSFRDWLFGGLRTGLYWMGPSLLLMLGGAALAKGFTALTGIGGAATIATTGATEAAIAIIPFSTYLMSFVPMALAAQAAGIALYFGVEKLAAKLGAGKAAPWLGGAAALALAAGTLLTLTASPMVIAATLALEAGAIWTAAKSRSFVAPLALRSILTIFSLEAARLGAWLKFGGATALVGLPPFLGGLGVLALVLVAVYFKAPGLKLAEIGAWWKAPEAGQRPKSPMRVLSAGLLWGLVIYAFGDLIYWAINSFMPQANEPAPEILAKMLTGGVDLVLYNFVIVALLEEYVFRRGLYKTMNDKLDKWGMSVKKAFWTAAIVSGLIFSGVHYIDWGAALAWLGLADAATAAGMGGAYAFTWASFTARAALGVVFAWMYKRSGFLMIPIVAHFWANTMEGLGLRWGLPAFYALAAGALILSFLMRPKAAKPKSS